MIVNIVLDFFAKVAELIGSGGYIAIFFLMVIESTTVPVILPAEFIIVTAGYYVGIGELNMFITVALIVLGSMVGSTINYWGAHFIGRKYIYKYGKYLLLSTDKLAALEKAFAKHAIILTYVGRLTPFIKHMISLPAGLTRMNMASFLTTTGLGSLTLTITMMYIGFLIGGNKDKFEKIRPYITISLVFIVVVILIVYYAVNKLFFKEKDSRDPALSHHEKL